MNCHHCESPHPHMHKEGCSRLNLVNWPELQPPKSAVIERWRGQKIDDMTREELIVALKTAGRLYNNLLERAAKS